VVRLNRNITSPIILEWTATVNYIPLCLPYEYTGNVYSYGFKVTNLVYRISPKVIPKQVNNGSLWAKVFVFNYSRLVVEYKATWKWIVIAHGNKQNQQWRNQNITIHYSTRCCLSSDMIFADAYNFYQQQSTIRLFNLPLNKRDNYLQRLSACCPTSSGAKKPAWETPHVS